MPNGIVNNNHAYDREMKLSEWRGYMKKAVEDINDEIKDLKIVMEDVRKSQISQQIRVATISGGFALAVTIVTILISSAIMG